MEFEQRAPGSLNPLERRPHIHSDSLRIPRCISQDSVLQTLITPTTPLFTTHHQEEHQRDLQPRESPSFSFPQAPTRTSPFTFFVPFLPLPRTSKRTRHLLDVDGPNTASLPCKKRRLRTELITSRLSQPYSQPATHILNREGQKAGDRRFLKMASTLDTARRIVYLHATSMLRFSVMNRLRRRLGVVPRADEDPEENEKENEVETPSWPEQDIHSSGGKYLEPSGHTAHPLRISKPAALPLPSADISATQTRTSPRIHPVRSPESYPPLRQEEEEDGFAYLHADEEDDDDESDVYSDFSVIFGEREEGENGQGEHSYEEYLDELDGLSWVTR